MKIIISLTQSRDFVDKRFWKSLKAMGFNNVKEARAICETQELLSNESFVKETISTVLGSFGDSFSPFIGMMNMSGIASQVTGMSKDSVKVVKLLLDEGVPYSRYEHTLYIRSRYSHAFNRKKKLKRLNK